VAFPFLIGHNVPQEAPQGFSEAVVEVTKVDRRSAGIEVDWL
jgi:hypothetical protein